MQSKRLWTIREAASALGLQPGTLYTWAWKKKGLRFVHVGRALRVSEKEIEAFVRRNTTHPIKEQAKDQ